jgi:butyrate kinase
MELEKRGIPCLLISTTPFTDAVATMARLGGMPDIRWAIVDHPLGSLAEAELRARAVEAARQFREIMICEADAALATAAE